MKLARLWRIQIVCYTTLLMFSCSNSRVVNIILDLKCLFCLEKQIIFYRALILWNTPYFSWHHTVMCISENKRSFPQRHKVFLDIVISVIKIGLLQRSSGCLYEPEMKYKRNEISFLHEKYFVYITFYCGEMICNFVSGVLGVNQPIKKCNSTRARYIGKHVQGINAGIYYGAFMLNQLSGW